MSTQNPNRKPAGVPVGGQFATTARTEPEVALVGDQHWVMIEREHGGPLAVGPFDSEAAAEEAMEDGVQVQGLVEDDCLDCYVGSGELAGDVGQVSVAVDLTNDDDDPSTVLAETRSPARQAADALEPEWQESFDALRAVGMDSDADDPIAARYRTASDALNHALRKTDWEVATSHRSTAHEEDDVAVSLFEHQVAVDPVGTLTALATDLGVDPEGLDDAVRDVTDTMASNLVNADPDDVPIEDSQDQHYGSIDEHAASINNGGIPAQVAFLVAQAGAQRTQDIVRAVATRADIVRAMFARASRPPHITAPTTTPSPAHHRPGGLRSSRSKLQPPHIYKA